MALRPDGKKPRRVTVNCLVTDGGMGDLLGYLTVVDHIIRDIPWIRPLVWVPDYLYKFAVHVLPKGTTIGNFEKAAKHYNGNLLGISTRWNTQHSPMRMHPIDYAAHVLIDADLEPHQRNYLKFNTEGVDITEFKLPEKYVVISVGATTKTKELPVETMSQIVDYVKDKGYTPVFLGKRYSHGGGNVEGVKANLAAIDYSKGIDLCDKTDLLQAAAILAGSKAYIGMEGGLGHLAGYTDIPIIIGYSFVDPAKMLPIRNNEQGWNCYPVVPESTLVCRFCQTRTPLLYEANFQECYYDDYVCLKQINFPKWKKQIDKVL